MKTDVSPYLRKYFIMGSQNCERNPSKILEEAAQAGITAFQFREKGEGSLTGSAKLELGKELREICRRYQIPFIINDDIELAEALDVDGIHVGQDDQPVEMLRQAYPNKIIGLSISNSGEAADSPIHLVDYVGAGPIFSTTTKEDAKKAVGLEWIQTLRAQFPKLPIVGIGGINIENAASVLEAGADGVSVISAIAKVENIADSVRRL
ncbi:thiamine phosphate synthase [Bacillaceae bacterium S4-13-56]